MEDPSASQSKAVDIFSDMVMQEAIHDKTVQFKEQLKDEESGAIVDPSDVGDYLAEKKKQEHMEAKAVGDEDEDDLDEEEEKILS